MLKVTDRKFRKLLFLNWKAIAIVAVLAISFYWFQLRPSLVYKVCHKSSIEDARKLMKSRADLDDGYSYRESAKKDWYLISDYENSYKKCLRSHGLET